MTKDEIRSRLKKQRNGLLQKEQESLSSEIRSRLLNTEAYHRCEMLFPYMSFRSEVDTVGIIRQALKDGKKVYLPRVKKEYMDFYEIHNLEGLVLSDFGISEPPEEESLRYGEKQEIIGIQPGKEKNFKYSRLMLMPGLAFDCEGNRIGYGAGYYDKYLAAHTESFFYKMALAYDFQIVDHIIVDKSDQKADAVLTPTRLILAKSTD